jgi:hypothetical protein
MPSGVYEHKKHTEESKKKISEASIGRIFSQKTRNKLSKRRLDKHKLLGYLISPEVREKIRITKKLQGISKEQREKMVSKIPRNEEHYKWKGDEANYRSKHQWIVNHFGQPTVCEHCKKEGLTGHKIHWANKSHEYKRNREDWLRLCVKCHSKFDN